MVRRRWECVVVVLSALVALTAPLTAPPAALGAAEVAVPGLPVTGDITSVHDPMVAEEAGTFWLFSTGDGVRVRRSDDLIDWQAVGSVFGPGTYPSWWPAAVPGHGGRDVWAPDVTFFGGRWHLFYAISVFGYQQAAVGHASTPTLDPTAPGYGWVDHGPVVTSAPGDPWTAIDPAVAIDGDGTPWLAWGSFWGGIWIQPLDPATGERSAAVAPTRIAERGPFELTEAPFLVHRDGWWYLFTSWDRCCAGVESTYQVRVGRAADLRGPFVDASGRPLLDGGGTLVLSRQGDLIGPGHNSVLQQGSDWWLVHHFYDGADGGTPTLGIQSLQWDEAGWPRVPGFEPEAPVPPATPIGVDECRPDGPLIETGSSLISSTAHRDAVEQPTPIDPLWHVTGPEGVEAGALLDLVAEADFDAGAVARRILEERVRPQLEPVLGADVAGTAWVELSILGATTSLPLPEGTAASGEPTVTGADGLAAAWGPGALTVGFPELTADTRAPAPAAAGAVRYSLRDTVATAPRTIEQHAGSLDFALSLTIGLDFLGTPVTGGIAGPWHCRLTDGPLAQTQVVAPHPGAPTPTTTTASAPASPIAPPIAPPVAPPVAPVAPPAGGAAPARPVVAAPSFAG